MFFNLSSILLNCEKCIILTKKTKTLQIAHILRFLLVYFLLLITHYLLPHPSGNLPIIWICEFLNLYFVYNNSPSIHFTYSIKIKSWVFSYLSRHQFLTITNIQNFSNQYFLVQLISLYWKFLF